MRGSDIALRQALRYCDELTRRHSSTFYLGSRLFPARQRQAVSVVYAVCRSGDDAVDEAESATAGRERLAHWWQGVERAYAGEPCPDEPLELALAWVLKHYEVPKEAFTELYLGFRSDLDPQPFEDLEELLLYCRRVAGVVGLMVAPIAGYRGGEATLQNALALGQAMQLTNILRDVGEDLLRGRCYLPKTLLARHGVTVAMLREGRVTESYRALLEELAELCRQLYRQGWRGIPKLRGPAASAVAVAALNYEEILHKLRQNGYDNLTRRAHLRPLERLALIPRAVYGVLSQSLA
ncbi:MAG: phytoene/squalene synthase family protein [Truepera sp.]|nr:phytoene/squalene synthase family protein [Truepera sp.]